MKNHKMRPLRTLLILGWGFFISAGEVPLSASGCADSAGLPAIANSPVVLIPAPAAGSEAVSSGLKADYAAQVKGKTGTELLQTLHNVTGPGNGARINIWAAARKYLFTADRVTVNGASGILTAYSQIFIPGTSDRGTDYPEPGDSNGDGFVDSKINVEHTWPAAFFDGEEPMLADLHHLQLTFEKPNAMRGNLPFGKVSSRPGYATNSGSQLGIEEFEPCDANKGNTARALLYFFVRYYDRDITLGGFDKENFWNIRLPALLEWNRLDPPDDNERRRNDLIEQFQGNRNPFIDDPSLADRIGIEAFKIY